MAQGAFVSSCGLLCGPARGTPCCCVMRRARRRDGWRGGEGSKEGGTETWEEAVRQGARQPSKARDELAAGVSAKASLRRGLFVHSRGDVSAEPHRRPSVGQSAFCRSHPLARDTLVPTGLFLRGFCSNTEEKSAPRWHFPLVARQNSRSSGPNALLLQKGPLICIESDPTLRAPKIKSAATSLRLFGRQNCHYSSSWTVDRIRIETFSLDQKVCACACKWWWGWGVRNGVDSLNSTGGL